MGRKTLPESKVQIASRVSPALKRAIEVIAYRKEHTESKAIEILLRASPEIKAEMRRNGTKERK